jgi:hypothetical protein
MHFDRAIRETGSEIFSVSSVDGRTACSLDSLVSPCIDKADSVEFRRPEQFDARIVEALVELQKTSGGPIFLLLICALLLHLYQ